MHTQIHDMLPHRS